MIQLYRLAECSTCDEIEATLQEIVIAHQVITVSPPQWPENLAKNSKLPILIDNNQIVEHDKIKAHLNELAQFVNDWNVYQGDACYINEDGEVC